MKPPRLTVIIPTSNRAEALVRCVESVLRGHARPERILVIDNNSTDDTRQKIRALARKEPCLRLLAWKKNNVSAARNRGARAARTEWIAFLDDDCVVPPVWLERAARFIRRNREKPMILGGDYLQPGERVPPKSSAPPARMSPGFYLPEGNLFMPRNNLADARHLAVATFHRCDFLLTWNCRHLANGNKLRHLRKINEGLGLPSPDLVTPLELMEDSP